MRRKSPSSPGWIAKADPLGLVQGVIGMIVFVLPAMLIGAFWGAMTALKRGGRRLDALQYGAVYAIALGLIGVLAYIILGKLTH